MNISEEELKKIFEREFNRVWSMAFKAGAITALLEVKRFIEGQNATRSEAGQHGNN
jgi:hypothetical protein